MEFCWWWNLFKPTQVLLYFLLFWVTIHGLYSLTHSLSLNCSPEPEFFYLLYLLLITKPHRYFLNRPLFVEVMDIERCVTCLIPLSSLSSCLHKWYENFFYGHWLTSQVYELVINLALQHTWAMEIQRKSFLELGMMMQTWF